MTPGPAPSRPLPGSRALGPGPSHRPGAARAPLRHRVWATGRPLDVRATWGTLRHGVGDPTWREAGGELWRGVRTPEGPVTLRLWIRPGEARVAASAWGAPEAAGWLLDGLPRMLGEDDDDRGFEPRHEVLAMARRRHPGWRVPRTGLVMESLVPAVLEQKVTGQEAFGGYRRLVRRHGELSPGPGPALDLHVPPSVPRMAAIPSWEWLRLGVSPQRADTLARVLRVAARLEEVAALPLPAAVRRLRAVPGVGVWTAAETAQRALGDPDAVSFGDYHVPAVVGHALAGAAVDDHGMQRLLAPYLGHRFRVQRLLELAGPGRPRRGPRMAPRAHLPRR